MYLCENGRCGLDRAGRNALFAALMRRVVDTFCPHSPLDNNGDQVIHQIRSLSGVSEVPMQDAVNSNQFRRGVFDTSIQDNKALARTMLLSAPVTQVSSILF